MKELANIIRRVQVGETEAYRLIVHRFQDMAVGYSYAILGDFGLAEDAAQEAFIHAYQHLSQLRQPTAFPGWFRRIVYKQCDRLLRRKRWKVVDLDEVSYLAADSDLETAIAQREIQKQVHDAIAALPPLEREVVTLFYLSQFSQKEVSRFLEAPLSTVKSRLHTARKRLKEQMITMIQDNLPQERPSKDEQFTQKVMFLLAAAAAGDTAQIQALIAEDVRLVQAKGMVNDRLWIGAVNALDWAVMHQQREVIKLLLAAGADINASNDGMTPLASAIDLYHLPDYEYDRSMIDFLVEHGAKMDIFSALFLGDGDLVKKIVTEDPTVVHARGPSNTTPLCFAGPEEARLFLAHGADPLAITTPAEGDSPYLSHNPIQVLARWPTIETIRVLLDHLEQAVDAYLAVVLNEEDIVKAAIQADPALIQAQTQEGHVLGAGHLLLHLAVYYDRQTLVRSLLAQGADIHTQSPGRRGMMPLHVAAWRNNIPMAKLLIDQGASLEAKSDLDKLTPLETAEKVYSDGQLRTEMINFLQKLTVERAT